MNPLSGNDFENGQNTRKRLFDFFLYNFFS